ncbi:unnamed protein product [Brassica rapa]|uniref:Uncharacterized protein n=1 Tax=Brassica campestris TaxID=3711 RepID=A0A8D9D7I2_BRACM|nr:unnamed protein product [Brassica rapa]
MWKKGELVWVILNPSDPWIPGRILDPSEPLGILVSFFDLMKPRYVPKPCLRSFDRDSLRFRRFVNRALQTHFWNISFGLWCSCQPPIDSPYLERGYSLPCSPPLSSDSALRFVREMAVSRRVPLRRLAETNGSTAQILSFRRYAVDLNRSESVYEEVIENEKGHSETSDKEDETSKREEEVETENLNCSVREDGEAEKLQDTIDEEAGVETSDGECGADDEEEEKAEESRSNNKVDLRKMTLGEWFKFMEVHVQKQIVEETEKMFELMRSKALRVDQYIAEQKQAMGKGSV